mmetsp:Transcript_35844/g.54955  ORF Transcript_35844/g.54955 Transcript_35844/m.54955 type:complete len:189 (+) Transcript_35844:28-594(+)
MGPIRKKKDNCCVRLFKKIFKKMYPVSPKTAWTTQGKWLRTCLGAACFFHCLFFIFSMAVVGFTTMLCNLLLCVWSYSAYLTLREWTVLFYFFLLATTTIYMITDGVQSKKESVQVIGILVNALFYVLAIYFIGTAYLYFRKNGGIKGLNPTEELPEERLARKAKKMAVKGGEYIEKKIDEKDKDLEG